ncbi:Bifunctional lycopene cyclase/phytoene synthase [Gossypium arboreum]|uniref:Bifunctional lycopene cyclase/phytoene synthase n=1 Tax=Gossypium arboreum TaxID=29729 RepID=A0A0B0P5D2_GOSAR|nr:Bifunctional lycopene cyclase/phytoene synthase [Gossypium arboreum]
MKHFQNLLDEMLERFTCLFGLHFFFPTFFHSTLICNFCTVEQFCKCCLFFLYLKSCFWEFYQRPKQISLKWTNNCLPIFFSTHFLCWLTIKCNCANQTVPS